MAAFERAARCAAVAHRRPPRPVSPWTRRLPPTWELRWIPGPALLTARRRARAAPWHTGTVTSRYSRAAFPHVAAYTRQKTSALPRRSKADTRLLRVAQCPFGAPLPGPCQGPVRPEWCGPGWPSGPRPAVAFDLSGASYQQPPVPTGDPAPSPRAG